MLNRKLINRISHWVMGFIVLSLLGSLSFAQNDAVTEAEIIAECEAVQAMGASAPLAKKRIYNGKNCVDVAKFLVVVLNK